MHAWCCAVVALALVLPATADGAEIVLRDRQFHPRVTSVPSSDAGITIRNEDGVSHDIRYVHAFDFPPGLIRPGASTTIPSSVPYRHEMVCRIHPRMRGRWEAYYAGDHDRPPVLDVQPGFTAAPVRHRLGGPPSRVAPRLRLTNHGRDVYEAVVSVYDPETVSGVVNRLTVSAPRRFAVEQGGNLVRIIGIASAGTYQRMLRTLRFAARGERGRHQVRFELTGEGSMRGPNDQRIVMVR